MTLVGARVAKRVRARVRSGRWCGLQNLQASIAENYLRQSRSLTAAIRTPRPKGAVNRRPSRSHNPRGRRSQTSARLNLHHLAETIAGLIASAWTTGTIALSRLITKIANMPTTAASGVTCMYPCPLSTAPRVIPFPNSAGAINGMFHASAAWLARA
jgi:hypothetical protein